MEFTKLLKESESLINWLDDHIGDLEIKAEDRFVLAANCLEIAREHHKSIILLVSYAFYGSALALIRSMFEAYVRGVWMHRCATDKDFELFKKNRLKKKIPKIVSDIEKANKFETKIFSNIIAKSGDVMNSYTHSEYSQIIRRNTATTIEPSYDEGDVLETINFSNAIGILSALQTAILSGHEQLPMTIFNKAKVFMGEP
jgi:uncharacterized protein DUF6988